MNRDDPEHDDDGTDCAVVQRVLRGETQAFELLVRRHQQRVFRLVRGLVPTHLSAEDVAQDVFVSAYLALASFDAGRGRFGSWLLAIARNRCLNANKRFRVLGSPNPVELSTELTPADELDCAQTMRCLDQALLTLPDEQRSAFVFAELVGLDTEDIAAIEGCAAGTIRSRLCRAKAALLAALDKKGEKP